MRISDWSSDVCSSDLTVGLSDVDWPELVCAAPLSPDRKASTNPTISILNAFVRALRSTETKPTAGIMLKTTALNVPIALIDVEESRVPEVFKGARHRSLRLGDRKSTRLNSSH